MEMPGEELYCAQLKGQGDLDDAVWEGSSSSAQSSDLEADLTGRCEVDQVDTMSSLPPQPIGACHAKTQSDDDESPYVNPPSIGSIGHPKLCNSLCLHVERGTCCPHGAACTRCHNPRCARRRCLCKKSRTVLSQVDDCAKFGMVWPILKTKVDELGLGNRAAQALEKWRCDVMSMPEFAGRPMGVRLSNPTMLKELNAMKLSDLCVRPILPDGAHERAGLLLIELRIIASATDTLTMIAPAPLDHD